MKQQTEKLGELTRRFSSATVLFHHAMADHLGLGPTDHKCLELLFRHQGLTGSKLAAMTGLTTGAITGVVNRLERAGYVRRLPDPDDGRRQILQLVAERVDQVSAAFAEFGADNDELIAGMSPAEVAAVRTFLHRANEQLEQRAARLRAETLHAELRTGQEDRR